MYCIKESFNKEFEEVFRLKKAEIARIQEKNVRISKIISQLKLEEAIVQPSLDADEEPERLLTVEVSHVIREARVMNTRDVTLLVVTLFVVAFLFVHRMTRSRWRSTSLLRRGRGWRRQRNKRSRGGWQKW